MNVSVRPAVGAWGPYLVIVAALGVALAASGAPSPTYPGLAARWGLSSALLTLAYAAYGLGVIAALLVTGGISDRIGRRPVIVFSLLILAIAMIVLAGASGLLQLIAGRLVQGIATGMLTGAAGAALTETHPRADVPAAAATNSMTTSLAIAVGALISGAIIAIGGGLQTPFQVMAFFSLVCAFLAALTLPRPQRPEPFALLRVQRLAVPVEARADFLTAALCVVAAWSVGGLYLALGGSLAQSLLGLHGPLVSGVVIAAVQGFGAVVQYVWVKLWPTTSNEKTVGVATIALGVGTTLTAVAAVLGSPAVAVIGSLLSGAGFGLAFMGGTRLVSVAAPVERRSEVIAAYFVIAYLAISAPAMGVGFLMAAVGPNTAFLIFTALIVILCVTTAARLLARSRSRTAHADPASHGAVAQVRDRVPAPITTDAIGPIKNIDVTLRDGGYRNAFAFTQEYAEQHARLSVDAGIDWIEVGYRGGSFNPAHSTGLTGRSDNAYIKAIAAAVGPEHVGVMVHPHNLGSDDLAEAFDAGARLLRVCLAANDARPGFAVAERAAELGYTVCVNATHVSTLLPQRLRELARGGAEAGAAAIYLADSNGSMTPSTVSAAAAAATAADIEVGFHTHNHLGLALANTISAVKAGASWVDSSVLGMGKGAGNLITEQWIAYLSRVSLARDAFNLPKILELSALLRTDVHESAPRFDTTDILMGLYDLSVENAHAVLQGNDHADRAQIARRIAGANA